MLAFGESGATTQLKTTTSIPYINNIVNGSTGAFYPHFIILEMLALSLIEKV